MLSGRYGPYIKHGAANANVPKGADPQTMTLEQAVALLAERAGKAPAKGRAPHGDQGRAQGQEGGRAEEGRGQEDRRRLTDLSPPPRLRHGGGELNRYFSAAITSAENLPIANWASPGARPSRPRRTMTRCSEGTIITYWPCEPSAA